MQLTMTGEYAIRAMMHLALRPNGALVRIADISAEWNIPESFLRKIVTQLAKARLVTASRGIGGGLRLARPAEELTLLDVISAIEGPLALNTCLIDKSFCTRTSWCAVHEVWHDAQAKMKEALSKKNLAELAERSRERRERVAPQPLQIGVPQQPQL